MIEHTGLWFSKNGEIMKAGVDFSNQFNSGIVLYEVLRIQDGVSIFLEDHLQRLQQSVTLSGLKADLSVETVRGWLKELARQNEISTGNIKVIAHYRYPDSVCDIYSFFIPHSYPTQEMYESGVDADYFKAVRNEPNVKKMHPDLIRQVGAFINDKSIYDALLVDENGFLTEGSKTNFFLIRENDIITAPAEKILKGITRQKILELCKNLGIPVREQLTRVDDVKNFDAAFFSGTSPKILPIRRISGYTFDVSNPLMQRLSKAYDELIAAYLKKNT